MSKKYCPFKKMIEPYNGCQLESFTECIESECMAWSENDKLCSLCSDKRVYNVEARVDTRYHL